MEGATEALPPPGKAASPPTAVLPSSTSSSGIQAAPPANISATASTSADVAVAQAAGQGSNLAFSGAAGSSPVALPPPHFAPPKAGEAMNLSSAEEDDNDDDEASDASQGPSSSQRPLNGAKGVLAAQYDSVNASPVPSSSRLTDEDSGTDDTGNVGSSVPSHRRKEASTGSSLKHVHRQKKGLEEAEANPDLYGLRRSVSTVKCCQAWNWCIEDVTDRTPICLCSCSFATKGPSAKESRE